MKKKIMALALVVALAAVAVTGTLAWFTDTAKVTNQFTIGDIEIAVREKQKDGVTDFVSGGMMLPIHDTTNPSEDDFYQHKVVFIENTGRNDAYIRAFVAIPYVLKDYITLDFVKDTKWDIDNGQKYDPNNAISDDEYFVYTCVYTEVLDETDGQNITDRILNGVYMNAAVDVQDNPDTPESIEVLCLRNDEGIITQYSNFHASSTNQIKVLVFAQAVQAEGFDGTALQALEASFGDAIPDFTK